LTATGKVEHLLRMAGLRNLRIVFEYNPKGRRDVESPIKRMEL
jgi:hypothetical protein